MAGAFGGGAAPGQVGGAVGFGRRMDMRVTAKTAASASATSPTTCAPTVEAPEVLATCSACPDTEGWGEGSADCGLDGCGLDDCGLTVGNSPAALPPGLRLDVDVGNTVGVGITGSAATGVVDIPAGVVAAAAGVVAAAAGVVAARAGVVAARAGVGGARMVMTPDAAGSAITLAAKPVAFRLTEVTVVAVAGIVS